MFNSEINSNLGNKKYVTYNIKTVSTSGSGASLKITKTYSDDTVESYTIKYNDSAYDDENINVSYSSSKWVISQKLFPRWNVINGSNYTITNSYAVFSFSYSESVEFEKTFLIDNV